MSKLIIGKTANDVWIESVNNLKQIKEILPCRTGQMYEIPHVFMTIENPQEKWVYNRVPPISIAFSLAEIVWIINGKSESKIINSWNSQLSSFSGTSEYYHGAYGERIRSHFGFDQLERAYCSLKNNPNTRQVVIQIYDTSIDFPKSNGEPQDDDIPCNICSILKIRDNKLEWSQIMRSNDILLGAPYNFVQYTSLQEILAGWLNIKVGSYNHYSDSLHLYERDVNKIGINNNVSILNTDSLSIPKNDSEKWFKEIYQRMTYMVNNNLTEEQIFNISMLNSKYDALNNIMSVITAYPAKKKFGNILSDKIIANCTNDLYIFMWNQWAKRK